MRRKRAPTARDTMMTTRAASSSRQKISSVDWDDADAPFATLGAYRWRPAIETNCKRKSAKAIRRPWGSATFLRLVVPSPSPARSSEPSWASTVMPRPLPAAAACEPLCALVKQLAKGPFEFGVTEAIAAGLQAGGLH